MSNITNQLRDLSPGQRELLLAKLREISASDERRTEAAFTRRRATSGELSFAQQRLWFLQQMYPEVTAYNCPLTIQINMPVDAGVLERSLTEIMRRHEILRTNFPLRDEQPIQSVAPPAAVKLQSTDLRTLPEHERESAATNLIRQDFAQPFDLVNGPCWRSFLLQLDDDKFILQVVLHHIVFDGWSIPIFLRELKTLYHDFARDQLSSLPALPVQYLDFAVVQRDWLERPDLQSQLEYWKNQLADAPPLLLLPADRPRPSVQSFRGTNQLFRISASLTRKLRELARAEDATLFMTLLAAFKTLLYRYSRQTDILIGTPIANRDHWEIENLIGLFLNTLVLRSKLSDNMTFRELLRAVRETCLDAYTHQELPFEKLVEELRPERDPRHTPIFQSMFVLQSVPPQARSDSRWSLKGMAMQNGSSQFDLSLNIEDRGEQLVGAIEYNTDIFEDATISRMIRNFETLLEGIVQEPETRVGYLPLLNSEERRLLIKDWNKTEADYPKNLNLPQLFEAQVRRSPQAPAVAGPAGVFTFEQLNRRTNQLAHRLRRAGVGPESVVAIYTRRSVEMVIAVLGVLKSGAAYLPLDPSNATSRLNFMLKDSGANVLVTDGRSDLQFLPNDIVTLKLDHEAANLANEDDQNPAYVSDPENLSYVLYTSGSTGKPKGVLIKHGSLVNHTMATVRRYGLNSSDRVLQFAAISFDVAAEELFPTLATGACVVLRPDELLSPGELMRFIEREKITVANLPSSYWHELVVELSRTRATLPPALRLIVIGSERAAPEKLTEWYNLPLDKPQLINAYGPTEATITTSTYLCRNLPTEPGLRSVPVGRPIANAKIYLLDPNLQLMPLGIPGELCVAGDLLSRGYLNQPSLTAEKFVPDPFSDRPGTRLYKTGDMARYLPDGNIELIGRTDHQIKFRGFRIELGEIESVLAQHPDVRDAVVLLVNQRNGHKPVLDHDIGTLAQQLTTLERETGLKLLQEMTSEQQPAQTDNGVKQFRRKTPSLDIRLAIADGFINTPQAPQRNWLLQRALDEFVDDLSHLDEIARRLVRGSERPEIENQWRESVATYDGSQLLIEGQQVMQDWERPLMKKMAEIVTQSHGDVLELGFGMGISATYIQQHGVRSHTIVECNEDVMKSFYEWKQQYPERDIRLIPGRWEDVTDQLQSYDGVFFDTYPLSEDEFNEYVIKNITFAEHFFPAAAKCLRPGGIFTYYTNEIDSFSRRHQQLVLKYFNSFTLSVVRPLSPPLDCHYWWADSMVAIAAVK